MATRRQAREWAFQLLFQIDVNPGSATARALKHFWKEHTADPKARMFAELLVYGVVEHREDIDQRITEFTLNWDMKRMGAVERNIIRMAMFELIHCPDVPAAVVINEAVDLAKYFGSTESGRFVNGILDRARKELGQKKGDAGTPGPAEKAPPAKS